MRNAQRKMRVAVSDLQKFADRALQFVLREPAHAGSELQSLRGIDVVLVSAGRIAALHEQFMKISGPTDVITFQHGEIVISVETARTQAGEFGSSTSDEIKLYIVHGLLHLHGFDDRTERAAREMNAAQRRVFKAASVA